MQTQVATTTTRARYTAPALPRIAALYPRVSDVKQDEDDATSLKTQEAGLRAWALANGYGVDEAYVYRERHSGEEYYERPELARLRADAKARQFAVVVVHSVERLARDAVHAGIVLEELERTGVSVHFVTEPDDDSPDTQLIRFIKAYSGRIENMRKVERVSRAVQERARQGKPLVGPACPLRLCVGAGTLPRGPQVRRPTDEGVHAARPRDQRHCGAYLRGGGGGHRGAGDCPHADR